MKQSDYGSRLYPAKWREAMLAVFPPYRYLLYNQGLSVREPARQLDRFSYAFPRKELSMKVIIIGGIVVGMSAASKLKREQPQSEIVVLERGDETSYGACGLPYYVSGLNPEENLLRIRPASAFIEQGIDLRLRHQATSVDVGNKKVACLDLEAGQEYEESYDQLVIATGADSILPGFPGKDLDGVFTLKTIADANRIKEAVDGGARRAVIIGGGYIGLELVESFLTLGLDVTVIEMAPQVLSGFDREIAREVEDYLKAEGVELRLNEAVKAFEGEGKLEAVLTEGGSYPADIAAVAVGVRPNTRFLEGTGLALLPNGAILTDEFMRASLPDIWAGGDCATVRHRILEKDVYIPLAPGANKQGRYIGGNLAGKLRAYKNALGTAFIKVGDLELGKTGLSESEAIQHGLAFETVTVKDRNRAAYYPGSTELTVKLVFEPEAGVLLGAQLIGRDGAALRTNVLAACITAGMTVQEIGEIDFGYSPPYARPWDVMAVAANVANRRFEK